MQKSRCILVTGAAGQIGTELLIELRKIYGNNNVIGIGRKTEPSNIIDILNPGPFIMNIDITNINDLENNIFKKYSNIDTIYHLAALLSGIGEKYPLQCWNVNVNGTFNIFDLSKKYNIKNILIPSSIAVYGPNAPKFAKQESPVNPTTMYGITKVSVELLSEYYNNKYGMNIRGLRLPGIISYQTMPGGGTTDYAVEIFYKALMDGEYTCFLNKYTKIPMMYMPDCVNAMINLMEFKGKLNRYSDFNVNGFSFDPNTLVSKIKKYIPHLKVYGCQID